MVAQTTFTHPIAAGTFVDQYPTLISDDLEALANGFYSDDASEPTVRFSCQRFNDGATDLLKMSNVAADAFFVIGKFDKTNDAEPPHFGVMGVYLTKDAEGDTAANVIRFTLQVTDCRADANADDLKGRRRVHVVISDATFGAPGGTQTVAVGTKGRVVIEHTAEQVLECETDADGTLELDVTQTGAATRYVRASIGDSELTELSGTWA